MTSLGFGVFLIQPGVFPRQQAPGLGVDQNGRTLLLGSRWGDTGARVRVTGAFWNIWDPPSQVPWLVSGARKPRGWEVPALVSEALAGGAWHPKHGEREATASALSPGK